MKAILEGEWLRALDSDEELAAWNKRGRGGLKRKDGFRAAALAAEAAFTEAKGDSPPFLGPVLVTVRGSWPPVKSGPLQGSPSGQSAALVWPICRALVRAGVLLDRGYVESTIASDSPGAGPYLEVEVKPWEG